MYGNHRCPIFEANLSPVNISISSDKRILSAVFRYRYARISQTQSFRTKTTYKVLLKSGDTGIKDSNGYQLDQFSDGTPKDDYVWYFKTKSEQIRLLNKVCVILTGANHAAHPAHHPEFKGEVITTNCNYLYTNQFSWA